MSSQLIVGTDWDQVRERITQHWGLVTANDLRGTVNSIPELVGVIQRKTGRDLAEVTQFVEGEVHESTSAMNHLKSLE